MPLFDYKCLTGHVTTTLVRSTGMICPICCNPSTRQFSFNIISSMPAHYNPGLGQYVSNRQQFNDSLKRQSESATLATGIEHTFQPVTLNDKEAHGVNTTGMDVTNRVHHDRLIT